MKNMFSVYFWAWILCRYNGLHQQGIHSCLRSEWSVILIEVVYIFLHSALLVNSHLAQVTVICWPKPSLFSLLVRQLDHSVNELLWFEHQAFTCQCSQWLTADWVFCFCCFWPCMTLPTHRSLQALHETCVSGIVDPRTTVACQFHARTELNRSIFWSSHRYRSKSLRCLWHVADLVLGVGWKVMIQGLFCCHINAFLSSWF